MLNEKQQWTKATEIADRYLSVLERFNRNLIGQVNDFPHSVAKMRLMEVTIHITEAKKSLKELSLFCENKETE